MHICIIKHIIYETELCLTRIYATLPKEERNNCVPLSKVRYFLNIAMVTEIHRLAAAFGFVQVNCFESTWIKADQRSHSLMVIMVNLKVQVSATGCNINLSVSYGVIAEQTGRQTEASWYAFVTLLPRFSSEIKWYTDTVFLNYKHSIVTKF